MKPVPAGSRREHEYEPQPGLPEPLPAGERLLWQGGPDWRALARHAFHVRKVALYFALLLAWRAAVVVSDGGSVSAALLAVAWLLPLPLLALGALLLLARLSARAALYTITDQRVVMRIGIVLTVTFNLPFTRIEGASLHRHAGGSGDLPLQLAREDRIGWLHLWPHARPWHIARPEPMLRCVPQAEQVAELLTRAWVQGTGGQKAVEAPAAVPAHAGAEPALAAR